MQVFESSGVYLATKKIEKNNPKAHKIESDNQKRQEWNRAVDMELIGSVLERQITEVKRKEIAEPIKKSIARRGNGPGLFARVVIVAVEALKFLIESLLFKKSRKVSEQTSMAQAGTPETGKTESIAENIVPESVEIKEEKAEPIIDKEVFYRVQEQIKSRRRQTKEKATPIFAGLVKCADCGWSMRFATNKANKTPYSYYACSYYGQFGKGNCSMHYIRYDVLYQAVLERLQYWAKAVQQDEEKVLNKIQKVGNAERIREKKKKASALKKAENRQNEIDRLFTKMYEDRACEKITERNFVMLSSKYQKEQIELEQQITSLREELSKMEQDMIGAEKWIELIKEYSVPKELTAPLLNAMIEKILIHEATTNEDNERIQEIEIYYRFIGKVD